MSAKITTKSKHPPTVIRSLELGGIYSGYRIARGGYRGNGKYSMGWFLVSCAGASTFLGMTADVALAFLGARMEVS